MALAGSTLSLNSTQNLAALTVSGALTGNTGTFSGKVTFSSTTDSAANDVGSVILAGGLYSAKKIRALGTITSLGGLTSANGLRWSRRKCDGRFRFCKLGVCLWSECDNGWKNVTGNSTSINAVTIPEPSAPTHAATKNYVDGVITSTFVNGFLFFVTTTHNGVTLGYHTQKSYWHKIGLNLVCVQIALQNITSASPSAADSSYTLTLPGGMPSVSPQKIVISQVDRSGALQNFAIAAGARDIYLTLLYQCD